MNLTEGRPATSFNAATENDKSRASALVLDQINATVRTRTNQTFLVWHGDDGKIRKTYTFGEIWAEAGRIAQGLVHSNKNLKRGDRAVLCYNFGANFFAAFLACLRAGVVPVLVYPPSKPLTKSLPRLNKVLLDCGAKVVLADTDICLLRRTEKANPLSDSRKLWPATTPFVDTVKLANQKQGFSKTNIDAKKVPTESEDLCFLQYTSGSISEPKGVMVTHGALQANISAIGRAMTTDFKESCPGGVPEQITGCSWLPPYHDMGLIQATIAPFVNGYKVHMMSPVSFLRNPLLWIQLMSQYKVHWTVAPDFAYRLVAKKFKAGIQPPGIDLSSVHILQSGAEPIRADTKSSFESAFRECGLRNQWFGTGYGLAENVVFCTYLHEFKTSNMHRTNENSAPFVAVGHRDVCSGVNEMKIVDPETHIPVPDGEKGELWVAGPSVAAGYLGQPELSYKTFRATLAGDESKSRPSHYLRTGDLAFVDHEGYLYICGRIRDLIVHNGRNIMPQDIEHTIEAASSGSVRPGCVAAFSSNDHGHDGDVEVVFEIRNSYRSDAFEICKEVVSAVSSSVGVIPSRVVAIPEKAIPKTSSGKIQRRACRAAVHAAELPVVFDWSAGCSPDTSSGNTKSRENLLHVLVTHTNQLPNHQVFTWVDDGGKESTSLTYAELFNKSFGVKELLKKKKTKPGERVVIAYPFGLEFLAGIFGVMLAGCVPCSVYPPNPSKLATDMPRFNEIVNDAGATLALTTTRLARAMKAASIVFKSGVTWLPTDRLPASKKECPKEFLIPDPEEPALIQYTSGTTSKPKGVILSHRSLYKNGEAITKEGGFSVDTKSVIWAPQYHDMGLIVGFITSLFSGSRLFAFSPLVFLKNPLLWDDLVTRYQAHATIAPNFGYALLLKRLREVNRQPDWSFMQRVSIAAEPTREEVVNGIREDLGVARQSIWNVYGMAECGVFITGGSTSCQDGLMSCGPTNNEYSSVRIVDSNGQRKSPGEEGLIWVKSTLVASGYLNQSELTINTFFNQVEGEEGQWLNTGDLGKIVQGTLLVSGREKEIMIIAGVNHSPTSVEGIVEREYGQIIRPGRTAAFQFSSQTIGIVCELKNEEMDATELQKMVLGIKLTIQQTSSLQIEYLAVLKQGAVPKTTSGKLKRTLIRKKCVKREWLQDEILHMIGKRDTSRVTERGDKEAKLPTHLNQSVACLGSSYGTSCPHAKFGSLTKFYAKKSNHHYKYDAITEHATTSTEAMHDELRYLDRAFPAGQIQRDPYEAGAFRFVDHRFWKDLQGQRPFALGNAYYEKLKARSWIASLLKKAPNKDQLQSSAAAFLETYTTNRAFNTSSIEKWVVAIFYQWIFGAKATEAFIDDFVSYQWQVFDMVMKPFQSANDAAVLLTKESYLNAFVSDWDLTEEQASWAMDMLLFPGIQVTFLLRCGLGVQFSNMFQQKPCAISQQNVSQFVWECIRMFPPFPALPWWKDGERHLIVLGMCGIDPSLWGSDVESFNPNRLSAAQFDERSSFFGEQSQLFQCPAKSFALKLASSFFLEFEKTGLWAPVNDIPYSDVQPYFDNFNLKRVPKVVVIGGGVAGLTCALRLAQRGLQVTLVERNDMIGGHSRHAKMLGGHTRNPAFGAFQSDQWPNTVSIMDELQVERISHGKASEFAVRFARDGHSVSPSKATIARFFADMREVYASGHSTKTIGQFLDERGYDETFLFGFFFGSIIHIFAGLAIKEYLEMPVHLVAWLALGDSRFSESDIYRVRNEEYMTAFADKLKTLNVSLRLGCTAEVLSRDNQRCYLRLNGEESLVCDQLVLATPPDAAIGILGKARTSEELMLHSFDCQKETVVLHQDSSWSDPNGSPLALMLPNEGAGWPSRDETIPMTTHICSDTDDSTSIFATYSYANFDSLPIKGDFSYMTFTHVRITHSAEYLRNRLLQNQGQNNTYLAGGWTRGLMLHEDAIISGLLVANSILETHGEKPFQLLNRKIELVEIASTPIEPPVVSKQDKMVVDGNSSLDEVGLSDSFDRLLTAVFGYDIKQEHSWADVGLSSVMSVELGDAIANEFQITLPADWMARCPTASLLKKLLLSHQRVPIEAHLPELKKIFSTSFPWPLFAFLQLIGCAIVVVLFALPFLLSLYLGAQLSEQKGAMMLLYPLILPAWVLAFSVTAIGAKWILVGSYQEGQLQVSTLGYLRWWMVDRYLDLWESLIGQYIVETPLLNLFYLAGGANIDLSVKLSAFVREFDLVTIEKGTSLSFCIRPRRFGVWEKNMESPVLRFRSVSVGANCDIKGMVSLGATLGDNVTVEPNGVIGEGGQVPESSIVEGNLASVSGRAEPAKPGPHPWWQLGLLKMLWQVAVVYLFCGALGASHLLVGSHIPATFRYSNILAVFINLILGSLMLLVGVVPLKWIVIGKRRPGPYKDTLVRAFADYCVDYLYATSFTFLNLHYTNSRAWNVYFKALGMSVDMRSKFFALSFAPSNADLITLRDSFASTSLWETSHSGEYHTIEVNESSIGWDVTLGPGVSISRAAIPPHTNAKQNVICDDPDDRNRVVSLRRLFKEEVERFLLMTIAVGVTFASLIPSAELWWAFSPDVTASPIPTMLVLALAMVLQSLTWVLLARILQYFVYFESAKRSKPWSISVYASFESGYRWAITKYSLLRLLSGGPLFNCYASFSGATMEGRAFFSGNSTLYDGHYVTIADRTVIDSAVVDGHFQIFHELNLGPSRASGTLHPFTLVGCNSVATAAESGPCRFVTGNDTLSYEETRPSEFGTEGFLDMDEENQVWET